MEFESADPGNYAELAVDSNANMTEFSLLIWLKTTASSGTVVIFSYSSARSSQELVFSCQGMQVCQLTIGAESR